MNIFKRISKGTQMCLAGIVSVFSVSAFAAVPPELITMLDDLATDAGTIATSAIALAVAAFAVLWLIRYAKKAARTAS